MHADIAVGDEDRRSAFNSRSNIGQVAILVVGERVAAAGQAG